MQYTINACTGYYTNIASSVPAAVDKVWTIRKNEERILITCNDEVIIRLYYVDGLSNLRCSENWSTNEEEVHFLRLYDTASDQFRILLGSATYFEPPTFSLRKLRAGSLGNRFCFICSSVEALSLSQFKYSQHHCGTNNLSGNLHL